MQKINSILDIKEKGGFWVPNEFMDKAAPVVRGPGCFAYMVIARCSTVHEYPNIEELAEICKTSKNKMDHIVDTLFDMKFLNYNDVIELRKIK